MDVAFQSSVDGGSMILENYFSTKSVVLTHIEFRREFPWRKTPSRKRITKIAAKCRNTGCVANNNKSRYSQNTC